MAGKRTLQAGTTELGAAGEGVATLLVLQVESLTGSISVNGRVSGSGMTRVPLSIKKRTDDSALTSIAANGVYEVNLAGLDAALVVTTGPATVAYQFVAG